MKVVVIRYVDFDPYLWYNTYIELITGYFINMKHKYPSIFFDRLKELNQQMVQTERQVCEQQMLAKLRDLHKQWGEYQSLDRHIVMEELYDFIERQQEKVGKTDKEREHLDNMEKLEKGIPY